MTDTPSSARSALSALRIALGASGAVSLIVGILILVWPGRTAMVVTGIIAVYAVVAGIIYGSVGFLSGSLRGSSRFAHIGLGVLFVVAGIIAFFNLAVTTEFVAVFLGVLVGIMWVVEGIVALSTLGVAPSAGWSIFFAIVSILAGVLLLLSPLLAAVLLFWLLGISLVVIGVFQIVRAITLGRATR